LSIFFHYKHYKGLAVRYFGEPLFAFTQQVYCLALHSE